MKRSEALKIIAEACPSGWREVGDEKLGEMFTPNKILKALEEARLVVPPSYEGLMRNPYVKFNRDKHQGYDTMISKGIWESEDEDL